MPNEVRWTRALWGSRGRAIAGAWEAIGVTEDCPAAWPVLAALTPAPVAQANKRLREGLGGGEGGWGGSVGPDARLSCMANSWG